MTETTRRPLRDTSSETDEPTMVRLLAFALHADDSLEFGRGLSTEDEPDRWRRD